MENASMIDGCLAVLSSRRVVQPSKNLASPAFGALRSGFIAMASVKINGD
jgi:hypothetical protein